MSYGMGFAGTSGPSPFEERDEEMWMGRIVTEGYDPPVSMPRDEVPASEAIVKNSSVFCQGCCDKMVAVMARQSGTKSDGFTEWQEPIPLLGRWRFAIFPWNYKHVLNGGHEEYIYQEWRGKVYNLAKTGYIYKDDTALCEKGCPCAQPM